MILYIGADHKGFDLKEVLKGFLKDKGYQIEDCGDMTRDPQDHYPDFARAVAEKITSNYENARGILICGSGVGMDIAANKFRHVRAGIAMNPNHAFDARNDDDANILVLASDYTTPDTAKKIAVTWLETPFSRDPHHAERIKKIEGIEEQTMRDAMA